LRARVQGMTPRRSRLTATFRWIQIVGYTLLGIMVLYAWSAFSLYRQPADADHMLPNFEAGTRLMIHHGLNEPSELRLGDAVLVAVNLSEQGLTRLVSRAVGFAGDTVQVLADGTLVRNGEVQVEAYLSKPRLAGARRGTEGTVTVPAGHVFVLNDNRASSVMDSRDFGPLPAAQLLGKVAVKFSKASEADGVPGEPASRPAAAAEPGPVAR